MRSTFQLVQLTALSVLAATASAVLPATAQYYYPGPHIYAPAPPPPPPPEVHGVSDVDAAVRRLGLRPVSHVRIRGPVLVVDAVGQEGSLVRVSFDRYSGRVTRIVRIGRAAPQIVTVPEPYDSDDDEEYADYEPAPPYGGPSVVTRRGIEGRVLSRAPAVTGSVTRDPLKGVPKEFRGERARPAPVPPQRLAARPPDTARAAPLPKPRPADAPVVAQNDAPAQPAAKPAPVKPSQSPEARQDIEKFPPVQGFE